jgi:intein/homing endonuclease
MNYDTTDKVLGIDGLNSISDTMSRQFSGKMVVINPHGMLPIELTPEHPVLLHSVERIRLPHHGKVIRNIGEQEWVSASDITLDNKTWLNRFSKYVVVPRLRGTFRETELNISEFTTKHGAKVMKGKGYSSVFSLNGDTAWLLGIYVAEGHNDQHGIWFSLNHNEKVLHQRIVEIGKILGYSPCIVKKETSTTIFIPSRVLSRAFAQWCGHGAANKRIPDFILLHSNSNILHSFLDGYMVGDGYLNKDGEQTCATISKLLAMQLQLAYCRFGLFPMIHIQPARISTIQERTVTCHETYFIRIGNRPVWSIVLPDRILVPIKSVDNSNYNGLVYNLTTSSNTYLVSNLVVHNCLKGVCPKHQTYHDSNCPARELD